MSPAFRLVLGLCLASLPGCSSCERDENAKPESQLQGRLKDRMVRPLASAMHGPSISGFKQRLEQEAKDRTAVPLPAETVFAAFKKDGVGLERERQQMASPHAAKYCLSAHAGQKVQVTVCEHESVEGAKEHVSATQKLERPERRVARNGTTTVLTRRDLNNDVEAPLVDKIMRAFEALKAPGGD